MTIGGPAFSAGHSNAVTRRSNGRLHAKPSTKVTEDLSPLELLRRENELLRETINSADSAIEELEAQLQVSARLVLTLFTLHMTSLSAKTSALPCCA